MRNIDISKFKNDVTQAIANETKLEVYFTIPNVMNMASNLALPYTVNSYSIPTDDVCGLTIIPDHTNDFSITLDSDRLKLVSDQIKDVDTYDNIIHVIYTVITVTELSELTKVIDDIFKDDDILPYGVDYQSTKKTVTITTSKGIVLTTINLNDCFEVVHKNDIARFDKYEEKLYNAGFIKEVPREVFEYLHDTTEFGFKTIHLDKYDAYVLIDNFLLNHLANSYKALAIRVPHAEVKHAIGTRGANVNRLVENYKLPKIKFVEVAITH